MSDTEILINGHFKKQRVTGVQRYAREIIKEFIRLRVRHSYIDPPAYITSDEMRQLWMQTVTAVKVGDDQLLWSPTNIGPVFCENQVLTLHDISDQLHPEWFDGVYVKWRKLVLPPLLRRVRGVITVSEFSKQSIIDRYPFTSGKIKVIPNGVRTSHFYPRESEEVSAIKEEIHLNKPYIITVGSLDPRKNINGLLKGWNSLPPEVRKEVELVIIGASADKFNFHITEKVDSSVRFLGYIDYKKLPAIYSGAMAFIFPSLFEGFGLPVLEAMACQIPVITSDSTSLKEVAGDRALMVDPAIPIEIGNAIQQLIESEELRFTLGQKGYDYVQSFSWRKTAQQTLEYLDSLK